MGEKITDELFSEIKEATNAEDFLERNKAELLTQGLPEYLNALLGQKGLSRADVMRGSDLDKSYLYQIFSGDKTPTRDKIIALAFGLKLNIDETQKLLKASCNRELYPRDERDAFILFAIKGAQTIFETNITLIEKGFPGLAVSD